MRSKNTLAVFAALLLLIASTSILKAQREWNHLGDKHVDGNSDHDKISLGSSEGWFRQLQIRVEDAPVSFKRVVVHFGNGTDEELQFREIINPGESTRAMDLRGRRRIIKSVEFWYEKVVSESSKRPTVRLYGR
jgi:putative transposon-encoded protein